LLVATIVTGILLMSVGGAHADNLQVDDLTVVGDFTVNVDENAEVSYQIRANSGDGGTQVKDCNAADTTPATVTIHASDDVTVSPNPLIFTACKSSQTVNFSSSVAGDYEITASVADSGGGSYNTNPAKFTLHVLAPVDTTPPVITASDITKEKTGPTTPVDFNATAFDAGDNAAVPVTYDDNGPFTVGVHTVVASATDSHNNTATKPFTVTITEPAPPVDNTDPVIIVPADIIKEATGPNGADVSFDVSFDVSASDDSDESVNVTCTPASGSTFALGETTVNCFASDEAGNEANASFKVTVVDTTAPVITAEDIELEATGPTTPVSFNATATDLVDGPVSVSYSDSGPFSVGSHVVTVTATDSHGNPASKTFVVTVTDKTPPELSDRTDVTVEATSAAGAVVSYFPATAYDLVDLNVSVVYSQASESAVPLGVTTVNYSATDVAGNHTDKSFKVTVQDTTAPTLNLPNDVTVYGWNGFFQPIDNGNVVNKAKAGQSIPVKFSLTAGSAVASFSAPTATDLVDGDVSVSCDHASGSSFPAGDTVVNCSVTDEAGNTAQGSFTVHVKGGNQGLNIMAPNYPTFVQGSVPPTDTTDSVENYATTSVPGLTYDAAADQYVYVWKTDKNWAGKNGTLKVKLADGSVHTAMFNFTK
jgi:HYR domain